MAAVAAAPVALTSGVPSALLAPAPVEDTRFYASLAPTQCLPLLAVSGVTGKAFWIGSLPQPPEEEEETDDESDRELSDGEDDALDADAAAVKSFNITKIREERREESHQMLKLWRTDPARWLLASKIKWSTRHESKRAPARSAVPNLAKQIAMAGSAGQVGRGGNSGSGRSSNNSRRAGGSSGKGTGTAGSGAGMGSRATVSLKQLVAAGFLETGPEALWISYLNQTWHGSLDGNGVIAFANQHFHSPSAWAIHCKRIANPGKKADDGWKSVRAGEHDGPALHDVKMKFLAQREETTNSTGGESKGGTPGSDRGKRKTGLVRLDGQTDGDGDGATPTVSSRKRLRGANADADADANRGELTAKSPKLTASGPAVDMSWLDRFCDPAEAEGSLEYDLRGVPVAPGGDHASLVGKTVQVFWPAENMWHAGRVLQYDAKSGTAGVLYATGDVEQGVELEQLAKSQSLVILG